MIWLRKSASRRWNTSSGAEPGRRARAGVAELREQLDQEKRAAIDKVEARQKEQSDVALQQLEKRLSRETAQKLEQRDAAAGRRWSAPWMALYPDGGAGAPRSVKQAAREKAETVADAESIARKQQDAMEEASNERDAALKSLQEGPRRGHAAPRRSHPPGREADAAVVGDAARAIGRRSNEAEEAARAPSNDLTRSSLLQSDRRQASETRRPSRRRLDEAERKPQLDIDAANAALAVRVVEAARREVRQLWNARTR